MAQNLLQIQATAADGLLICSMLDYFNEKK